MLESGPGKKTRISEQGEAGAMELLRIISWVAPRRLIVARARLDATVCSSPPMWIGAKKLIRNWEAMSQAESVRLLRMYEASKKRLSPLSDPLDVQFPLHRQLSSSREEVYSDWLQWVLKQVSDVRLIGRILGSSNMEQPANLQEQISVDREVPVKYGHTNQTGRLDLVVKQGHHWLAVIEIKTRAYDETDLKKQEGYRKSINSIETELIFLSVNPPVSDLFGFRFLSWADVCVTLRGMAPHLLKQEQVLGTALILAFVGAVEQNLLGFVSPEAPPVPIGKVPRMVDHLTKAARMEEGFGEPKISSK